MIRNIVYWLILGAVVIGAGFSLYIRYQSTRPCTQTITYSIGAADSRFDISNSELIAGSRAAATIWNDAAGKTVLTYDPKAELKINLIYDQREENAILGSKIAQLQDRGDGEREAIDAMQARFLAEQLSYNAQVEAVNSRGGATRSEVAALSNRRNALTELATSINTQVAKYNASVVALNALVAEYNKSAGRTFEQGQYVNDSEGERINVFAFVGNKQLERVLAHEFGHAIGLDHNADPRSIMYAKNESGNLVPTAADIAALKALCGA